MKKTERSAPGITQHQQRAPREPLPLRQALAFKRAGTASGRIEPPASAAKAIRDASSHFRFREKPLTDEQLPNWMRALLERGAPIEEVLAELKERTLRTPTEDRLHVSLALANELARSPSSARAVRKITSQELMNTLAASSSVDPQAKRGGKKS